MAVRYNKFQLEALYDFLDLKGWGKGYLAISIQTALTSGRFNFWRCLNDFKIMKDKNIKSAFEMPLKETPLYINEIEILPISKTKVPSMRSIIAIWRLKIGR